ncbi:hypothetical protein HYQ46_012159 [Verticillium longisporum]|nr:hypothetical protein HYQ46_012159 [Verticillium longisporum]
MGSHVSGARSMPWRSWYDARPKSERHEATEPWRNRVSAGDTASWWSVVDNLRLGCSTPRAAASMNHVPDRKIRTKNTTI